jgi:hypothetical protein
MNEENKERGLELNFLGLEYGKFIKNPAKFGLFLITRTLIHFFLAFSITIINFKALMRPIDTLSIYRGYPGTKSTSFISF